eukprot:1140878-Pelagomonas_calceolata.AAC.8
MKVSCSWLPDATQGQRQELGGLAGWSSPQTAPPTSLTPSGHLEVFCVAVWLFYTHFGITSWIFKHAPNDQLSWTCIVHSSTEGAQVQQVQNARIWSLETPLQHKPCMLVTKTQNTGRLAALRLSTHDTVSDFAGATGGACWWGTDWDGCVSQCRK